MKNSAATLLTKQHVNSGQYIDDSFDAINDEYKTKQVATTLRLLSFVGMFVHVCFIFIFMVINVIELSLINIVSATAWALCLYTNSRHQFKLTITIMLTEIVIHACIATVWIGADAGFHFFIWPAMGLVLAAPFEKKQMNLFLCLGLMICFIIVSFMGRNPVVNVEFETLINILFAVNVSMAAFPFILTIKLIRQNKEHGERQLFEMANRDDLTGAYNRRFILNLMQSDDKDERRNKRSKDYAVVIIDIDNFKSFNDEHGNVNADQLLISVSKTIQENIRNTDVLARWGAGEFLLILNQLEEREARLLLDKVQIALQRKIHVHGANYIEYKFNIGAAINTPEESFEEVVQRADLKVFEAKSSDVQEFII